MGTRTWAAAAVAQLCLLACCGSASGSTGCTGDARVPTAATGDAAASALVCDVNEIRAGRGLRPLRWDGRLAAAAGSLATDMAQHHFLSHVASDGSDLSARIAASGYGQSAIRENIAWGSGGFATPLATAGAWMDSDEHRANVLDPSLRDVGIGVAAGALMDAASGVFYVADFGAASHAHAARTSKRSRRCATRRAKARVRCHGRSGRARRR
jgi:uncharacterized protein YkwD